MAGVQTFEEEFLTCGICTLLYINPCTLNCGHSLCRKCLNSFLESRPDAVQSKTIPCPFCRQVTPVVNPSTPVSKWAEQVRPSLILRGLMDRHQSEHKQRKGQVVCVLCHEVGETTPASYWCSDCEMSLCCRCSKMHLKVPSSEIHVLLDLSKEDQTQYKENDTCKEHDGEQITFVCKDCNKTACQTCKIQHGDHNIVSVESMIPEIQTVLAGKRQQLRNKMDEVMVGMRNEESKKEQLKSIQERVESEIKSEINIGINLLREKEMTLLNKLDDVCDKQMAEHQAKIKSCQITNQMYKQHCEFIDKALKTQSKAEMYDMYQVSLSGAEESMGHTRNTTSIDDISFTTNVELLRKAMSQMGDISVKFQGGFNTLSPVLQDSISIKHRQDAARPDPTDVTMLTINGVQTIVVADWANKCLKSLCTENRKVVSTLKLSDKPDRIVTMQGNKVVATLKGSVIVMAEARPELNLISTLKTSKQYWGVTALPDSSLAAGSCLPPAVDVLDLSAGKVLKSFTPHNTGLNLIQSPDYLSTTGEGNILVSDWKSKSVYCLTLKGQVAFVYTARTLEYPRGITSTNTGGILLADDGTGKILQITSDGTFVRDVLNVGKPWGLCMDDSDKLYVCDREEGSEGIKVYRFR